MLINVVAPSIEAQQLTKVDEHKSKLDKEMTCPLISIILNRKFKWFVIDKEHNKNIYKI